jgi:transposase
LARQSRRLRSQRLRNRGYMSINAALQTLEDKGQIELRHEFIELRAKGLSLRKAARRLKIGKSTAQKWEVRLRAEIATAKAIELEALYERAYLAHEQRVKLLSGQLKAIQAELKERGLSDVSTDKLLELQLKYLQQLSEERIETIILSPDELAAISELEAEYEAQE